MDLGELIQLLTHLKVLPAAKGGCGHLSKTAVSSIFKKANRHGKTEEDHDGDDRELDKKEFFVAMSLVAKKIGKQHAAQLLFLEEATTRPIEEEDAQSKPAIPVRQKKGLVPKDKRRAPPRAARDPQTIVELFTKFSAGEGSQVGKRAATLDLNEWMKMLVYLGVLPKDKDQPGKVSKTEATEVFKRAKVEIKSFKDPREMDAAECTAALRMVAVHVGIAIEGDADLENLLPSRANQGK